jgi:hypothetical protein
MNSLRKFLLLFGVFLSFNCFGLNWKSESHKDEMNGKTKILKTVKSTDGTTSLNVQFEGYGKNDNVVWVGTNKIIGMKRHSNFRVVLDGLKFSFGVDKTGDFGTEFIITDGCQTKENSEYECIDGFKTLFTDKDLSDLILISKEIKIEIPVYRGSPSIKVFK